MRLQVWRLKRLGFSGRRAFESLLLDAFRASCLRTQMNAGIAGLAELGQNLSALSSLQPPMSGHPSEKSALRRTESHWLFR